MQDLMQGEFSPFTWALLTADTSRPFPRSGVREHAAQALLTFVTAMPSAAITPQLEHSIVNLFYKLLVPRNVERNRYVRGFMVETIRRLAERSSHAKIALECYLSVGGQWLPAETQMELSINLLKF